MMGRSRDDLRPDLRSVVVEYYVVYFMVTDEEIQIRRIVHGSRDTRAVSFEED
jgi:toxin ParE1/3/4